MVSKTESSRSKRVKNSCNKEGLLSPTRIRKEIRQWTFQFYLYASKMIFFFLPSCVCVCALLKRVNLSFPLLLHWKNVLFDKRAVFPTLAQIQFCWLSDFPGDWSEFFSSSISFLSLPKLQSELFSSSFFKLISSPCPWPDWSVGFWLIQPSLRQICWL